MLKKTAKQLNVGDVVRFENDQDPFSHMIVKSLGENGVHLVRPYAYILHGECKMEKTERYIPYVQNLIFHWITNWGFVISGA